MEVKEARAVKEVITEKKHKCCLLNNIDGISDNIFESYRINESRRIKRCTFTIAAFFHSFIAQSLIQIRDVSKYMAFPVYNTFYVWLVTVVIQTSWSYHDERSTSGFEILQRTLLTIL